MKKILLALALSFPLTVSANQLSPQEKMIEAGEFCEEHKSKNQFAGCILFQYKDATKAQVDYFVEFLVETLAEDGKYKEAVELVDMYESMASFMAPGTALRTALTFLEISGG